MRGQGAPLNIWMGPFGRRTISSLSVVQMVPSRCSKEPPALSFNSPLHQSVSYLAIAEHAPARMSLGQWRRSARLVEISRPSPVPDLRHIFQVLSNIVVVLV